MTITADNMEPPAGGDELVLASRPIKGGLFRTELSVPDVHCGACIRRVEKALTALPGVANARVNLSTRRVAVEWQGDNAPPALRRTLDRLGYPANYCDDVPDDKDQELGKLIRALAVAGFAASNIMLLSVSVWSGAGDEARQLFHWLSALIALPTLAYSGRVFFASAWKALRHGHTNMDVPISLGVSLAFALSVFETATEGHHAYFDASVTLLFFLLIGRTLDHMMRERARTAVRGLARLAARGANVLRADGSRQYVPVGDIRVGDQVVLVAGDRVPVDGVVESGTSDVDAAMVSGEALPQLATVGTQLRAGTLNLTGMLQMRATAVAANSFLAEMVRLMEAAEGGRAGYRRIADRAAQLYSPVVHLTALLTFAGWMLLGADWHHAISVAITVLIITCPCALGLAVPIVQVVAARRLFENSILTKDGSGLERLASIDTVILDKTGTITVGRPRLANAIGLDPQIVGLAAALAVNSSHPLSRAIVEAADRATALSFDSVREVAGLGIEAHSGGDHYRLGRADWALSPGNGETRGTVLARNGELLGAFEFEDRLRADVEAALASLREDGLQILMVSGDDTATVGRMAQQIGVKKWFGEVLPAGKLELIAALRKDGHRVLMVGDGLNDAPALAGADVSIAPSSAADVGRNAADFVFLRESMAAVPLARTIARNAGTLIKQNLGFAVVYNAIAVPVAILGYATPLVAAIAMSLSSVLVVANALRLRAPRPVAVSGKPVRTGLEVTP
jgi:Cu2+-exporting ATPase